MGYARAMRNLAAFALCALIAGCAADQTTSERTSYARQIEPILLAKCTNSSGCHSGASAAGALDVTSYDRLVQRSDLLQLPPTGAPLLLAKASGSPHAGGVQLVVGSDVYLAILHWLDDGAPEN